MKFGSLKRENKKKFSNENEIHLTNITTYAFAKNEGNSERGKFQEPIFEPIKM